MIYRTYLNGELVKQGTKPKTLHGVKLSRIDLADAGQLEKHGIVIEEYTPPPPPDPTPEEIQAATEDAIQKLLDAKAQEYGFQSVHTAIAWGADRPMGAELKAWGKSCWKIAEQIRAAVMAGERGMPTIDEVLAEMPTFTGAA